MDDPSENLLIIFVKNLVPGRVKTRLASEIGIDGALDVYKFLVEHTYEITNELKMNKAVYYSEYVEGEDIWDTGKYKLFVQKGPDLGKKMLTAFDDAFCRKFKKVALIGSDCFALQGGHILEAFEQLEENDTVIGPATDGGFYLIGMKRLFPQLFNNKTYGHKNVLRELLAEVAQANISYHLLPTLSDIDTLQDLKDSDIDFEFIDPEEGDIL